MLAKTEKKKIPILMYHSISEHATVKFRPFTLSPELFAKHMAYLHLHAFTPITVTQFVRTVTKRGAVLPERPVVLTFDDGYADFFTKALPVLQQYNFTATLYIPTGFVGGTSRWLQREGEATRPILTWDQLTEISASGIECGGHSYWHRQLDTLPLAGARDEIVGCKRLLEEHLAQEVSTFAYPYGFHSTIIKRLVQEAGYTSACAVKDEVSSEATDPFALARLSVSADTSLDALATLLSRRRSSVVVRMYASIRASAWQLARHGSAFVMRYRC